MNTKSLLATARSWRHQPQGPKTYLHRFSDSALHTTLMIAIVVVASLAVVKAIEVGVTVWQLDKVVVTGRPSSR
ncbi:hypothetical protein J7U46_11550 [Pelomonas sp. V22]|uniref:hypothetical protein n=1 Tax=Pelomonas sp. V22 TaxID=2822139 RepID=UPI0024A7B7E2|nr:hypothetical protein [Pelomonas sp. V22]MDI4633686.1 hypothetical protein [Pelomonas sp. V22]